MPDFFSRPCEGAADLDIVTEFVRANLAARLPDLTYWHPGDVAWRLAAVDRRALAANVRLWSDAAGVAGVAMFEPPLNVEFDIRDDIAAEGRLLDQILEWAEARRRKLLARSRQDIPTAYSMLGESTLATTALDSDQARIDALTRRGYKRVERCIARWKAENAEKAAQEQEAQE